MSYLLSLFSPFYPKVLAYMFQAAGYDPAAFWRWWLRTDNFSAVRYRGDLVMTRRSRVVLIITYLAAVGLFGGSVLLFGLGIKWHRQLLVLAGAFGISFYPVLLALLIGVGLMTLLHRLVIVPEERRLIRRAKQIFHEHPGKIIAVAGSYGKTSMKELLATVLSAGAKVAATPGNKNVPVSHAYFANRLQGDEDYVIVELGEGYPGDIAKMTDYLDPDIAILTGVAPNHLDQYGSVDNLIADFSALLGHCGAKNSYANLDTPLMQQRFAKLATPFDGRSALGWKICDVRLHVYGTEFSLKKSATTIKLHSGLIGRANLAPVAFVAALALELGVSKQAVSAAIGQTEPFEHRLQPRPLGGGWIIDDTYNGSLEGMRAGLALLSELKTKGRKVYVTPGLVDQGEETKRVHHELGQLIAAAGLDEVVLMKNSSTADIEAGLQQAGYKGKLTIVDRPLEYYQNIDLVIAAGDIYMLQNDLPDNYN